MDSHQTTTIFSGRSEDKMLRREGTYSAVAANDRADQIRETGGIAVTISSEAASRMPTVITVRPDKEC